MLPRTQLHTLGGSDIRELELIWRCTHVVLRILLFCWAKSLPTVGPTGEGQHWLHYVKQRHS